MENNSDKEMRNKLQGMEFPFDPKAWDKMESMLNEDRKPRAFFWWWFGGVAACLLLATGLIGYYQSTYTTNAGNTTLTLNQTLNSKTESTTNSKPQTAVLTNPTSSNANSTTSSSLNSSNPSAELSNAPHSNQTTQSASTAANTSATRYFNNSTNWQTNRAPNNTTGKSTHENRKEKRAAHSKDKTNPETGNTQQASLSPSVNTASTTGSISNELIAQTANPDVRAKLVEPISLNPIWAFEFPDRNESADDAMKKREGEDVNLKKIKQQIFNYSLGIAANITGTSLGPGTGSDLTGAFNTVPSYMVGVTHDFMFFKRFAITNSILFSQTSFTVRGVRNAHGEGVEEYSSKISEIAIPIGLKVYAVSKPKFRFYLGASVINHIKLKETFTYLYYNLTNSFTGGMLPAQTQFGGSQYPASIGGNTYANSSYYGTADFSINHARRYYASICGSAGAEFILKKHYVLFTEPLFYMALQKIGVQDKYKYNLGLNGGVRYQF